MREWWLEEDVLYYMLARYWLRSREITLISRLVLILLRRLVLFLVGPLLRMLVMKDLLLLASYLNPLTKTMVMMLTSVSTLTCLNPVSLTPPRW